MIVHANGRVIGTTPDNNNPSFIKTIGVMNDSLSVTDENAKIYLYHILFELKKLNIHLQSMTDQKINDLDINIDIE